VPVIAQPVTLLDETVLCEARRDGAPPLAVIPALRALDALTRDLLYDNVWRLVRESRKCKTRHGRFRRARRSA